MRLYQGRISEIRLDTSGGSAVWISCPPGAIPSAGQYVRAHSIDGGDAAPGAWIFPGELDAKGFLALPPIPNSWNLGVHLDLWGPLGKGFSLPGRLQRLALAALGDTTARLRPLIKVGMQRDCSVTVFSDSPIAYMPSSVEVYPLAMLHEALDWPELLALDIPLESLPSLRNVLGLTPGQDLPCPAQALVTTDMPCAGLADCGVCAVPARRGWKLVCKDGPVFDLDQLEW